VKGNLGRDNHNKESASIYGKIPPQAKEIEEAVLGAILLEKDKLIDVLDIIKEPECFYVEAHQRVYSAIVRLSERGQAVDLLTVAEELRRTSELELIGGAYFITKLTNGVTSSAHAIPHSRVLLEKYTQRELIRISNNIIKSAYEDQDVFNLIQYAEDSIFDISIGKSGKEYRSIYSIADDSLQHIISRVGNAGKLTGIPTGFPTLDSVTGGWQKTDLIILAAKSGWGKRHYF
jgi:replicative DNA helicase